MSEALSISAAAAAATASPAIITATQTLTFGQCAAKCAAALGDEAPRRCAVEVVIATPSLETVLAIYAALEARRPIALLHPRSAPDDVARFSERQ